MMIENDLVTMVNGIRYVDPANLLKLLQERATIVNKRIAVPGVDLPTTEGLRGRYAELITLIQRLEDTLNG